MKAPARTYGIDRFIHWLGEIELFGKGRSERGVCGGVLPIISWYTLVYFCYYTYPTSTNHPLYLGTTGECFGSWDQEVTE